MSGPRDVGDSAALETALATAIRDGGLAPEAEREALAAFRAARGTGAHKARTRRRDDWRLPAERRTGRSVKTTFGLVFAGLTLGGVAVAAIGSVGSSADGADAGRATAHPSSVAPDRPGGTAPPTSAGGHGPTDRPATAKDTEAHCRAYEQVRNRGKALDSTAWQRLVAAAGGKDKVAAYCSAQLAGAKATPGGGNNPGAGSANPGNGNGNGTSGNTGASGSGTSGKGRSDGDKGGGKHK
ncbi:hypothetical protein [Streptomyces sp. NPDC001480]|uniref:hypothetical protein n=1 Tax=Streptomyces sp. NPDC001480 TaxID=3364577 RepID=UPI00369C94ED